MKETNKNSTAINYFLWLKNCVIGISHDKINVILLCTNVVFIGRIFIDYFIIYHNPYFWKSCQGNPKSIQSLNCGRGVWSLYKQLFSFQKTKMSSQGCNLHSSHCVGLSHLINKYRTAFREGYISPN